MDEGKMLRIQTFLTKNGASIDTISNARLNQLEKVDAAIQLRLRAITGAKELLKNSTINISVLSTGTEISRKTFYNNDLENDTYYNEYQKMKKKNDELIKQVHNFLIRDIVVENLRHDNSMLSLEIKNLENRNKSLEAAYEKI